VPCGLGVDALVTTIHVPPRYELGVQHVHPTPVTGRTAPWGRCPVTGRPHPAGLVRCRDCRKVRPA
jgi:hypothetical protein